MSVAQSQTSRPALGESVATLFGVGPERTAQLGRLDIHTIEDLLLHRPHRYEDRKQIRAIAELSLDQPSTVRGTVVAMGTKWFRKRARSIFELVLDDGTGRLHCRWWNLPYMEKYFAVGDEILAFGKPVGLKPKTIDHPETEVIEGGEESSIHLNRIAPIYPLTEGLPQRWIRSLIWRTVQTFGSGFPESWPTISANELKGMFAPAQLPTRAEAVRMLHFPEHAEQPELARKRLALDELVELQQAIQLRRKSFSEKAQGLPCGGDNHLIKPFLARLGFKLTDAQTRVLRELRRDLSGPRPMRRLLQGDVGSGKTVVAACCSLMAIESGHEVALMAPTEILAEQHWLNFSRWFKPLGIAVELLTGAYKGGDSSEPAEGRGGVSAPRLFIGTHALLEPGFAPPRLGLVIIDEQHRFGVRQREQFVRKGHYPHLLVMTATPIPRTLGLTLYGELDASEIDESPHGRGRVRTYVRNADKLPQVWEFIRSKLAEGRQAFVVYPRVEEAADNGIKAVTREFREVQKRLPGMRVGLLHGRLKTREKEQVMEAFRSNEVKVLLATTVVEVGVDVPNATVMLIENAEQFGLAQLHQLRGRIGRGAHESFCILVAAAKTAEARQRLQVLAETENGFEIAEADLKLRGPGELLGQQQSGIPRFRFADFNSDLPLIRLARELAIQLVNS